MTGQPAPDRQREPRTGSEPRAVSAVPVLISARNRPLYLWASLDSIWRTTRYPHRFTLLDMASDDPLVPSVLRGFERRGMFAEMIEAPSNQSAHLWEHVWRLAGTHEYLAYVETDVIIEDSTPCWLARMVALMEADPQLAMIGSAIDKQDFVTPEQARALYPDMPERELHALIKAGSAERAQDVADAGGAPLFQPHNPPGRLLLMRTGPLREIGEGADYRLHQRFLAAGYRTGIATGVRHRHLSLLHVFDYPDYDYAERDRYMGSMASVQQRPAG